MPNLRIVLAERAIGDYDEIMLQMLREWSVEQAVSYKQLLDSALQMIGEFPDIGVRDRQLPAGFRARIAGSHVICYRFIAGEVQVHRILHQQRDFFGQFDGEEMELL